MSAPSGLLDPAPVYLIGFMATGKSTVGRLVAERLGRRFVDLDDRVAERAGMAVPAIFKRHGERAFRAEEAAALAELAGERDLVVACGGGTPAFGDNLAKMRASGVVVALRAGVATVLARALAPGAPERPLLAGDAQAAAEKLFAERQRFYDQADVKVDTDGRDAEAVADEVTRRAGLRLGQVVVRLGERSYPVHVGGPLATAGALAKEVWGAAGIRRIAVITDENVAAAGHDAAVARALEGAGFVAPIIAFPAGEAQKTLATAADVAARCMAAGLDRGSGAIVAVGGGVVGDLAGFVAAMLFRGIPWAGVPTTLLAMVDSSIGGKTGVDTPAGKNLLGAFWQPRFVLAAPEALATLPRRELVAAFGEVVKYALLDEGAPLEALRVDLPPDELEAVIVRSAAYKADVVARDERELTGLRAVLNLGHTVGHAIEAHALTGPAPLLHGEAVALGLVAAARISARAGLAEPGLEARVAATNARLGLPHDLGPYLGAEVMSYLGADKKRVGAEVRFVALERQGKTRTIPLTPGQIEAFLRSPAP